MYLMKSDTYVCDTCGFELKWDESDDTHGSMWGCEICGKNFCTTCFIKKHGRKAFDRMLQQEDRVQCMECYNPDSTKEKRIP